MKRGNRGKNLLPAAIKDLPVAVVAIKSFGFALKCGNCGKTVLPAVTKDLPAAAAAIKFEGVL